MKKNLLILMTLLAITQLKTPSAEATVCGTEQVVVINQTKRACVVFTDDYCDNKQPVTRSGWKLYRAEFPLNPSYQTPYGVCAGKNCCQTLGLSRVATGEAVTFEKAIEKPQISGGWVFLAVGVPATLIAIGIVSGILWRKRRLKKPSPAPKA